MLQLLIAFGLTASGIFMFRRGLRAGAFDIGGVAVGFIGVLWFIVLLPKLTDAHIGVDSDIANYEQIRVAVRSARAGDPSYSGILMEAVQWNQKIAVSRKRIDSPWWGIYYSRQIADLELIEMPVERK